MSLGIVGFVFLGTFLLVSAIILSGYIGDGLRWTTGKPRNNNVMLGNDMRGRHAVVEEKSPCGQYFCVRIGSEYWKACAANQSCADVAIGDNVKVVNLDGLTLNVVSS